MNTVIPVMLLVFFISGLVVTAVSPVFASEAIADSWSTKTPMTQARTGLGVVAVDGKIYAIGGLADLNFKPGCIVGTNECYNPGTDTWVTLEPMPTPRVGFAIATCEGKIYCIGGSTFEQAPPFRSSGINEVYDVATNSWSVKSSMPVEGATFAGVVNDKFFVMADYDLFMYDPVADVWTQKTSMPKKTSLSISSYDLPHSVSVAVDDKIIVTGYFPGIHNEPKTRIYDTKTDTWSEGRAPVKPAKFNDNCTGVTSGVYAPQSVYALSGTSGGVTERSNQVYDPVGDIWTFAKDMPTYRNQFGVAVVDDILYVIGGHYGDDVVVSVNEQYVPLGYNGASLSVTSPPVVTEPFSLGSLCIIVVTLTMIVVGIGTGLIFYSKKSQKQYFIKQEQL